MKKIKSASDLKNAIEQLELERSAQFILLKVEFHSLCESLKPINIIKAAWKEAYSDENIKATVTDNLMGAASGTLVKKIILGKTNNPITGLMGILIEKLVSKNIVKNSGWIKTLAGTILEKVASPHD